MNFAGNWAGVFVEIKFLTFGEAQIIGGIIPIFIDKTPIRIKVFINGGPS